MAVSSSERISSFHRNNLRPVVGLDPVLRRQCLQKIEIALERTEELSVLAFDRHLRLALSDLTASLGLKVSLFDPQAVKNRLGKAGTIDEELRDGFVRLYATLGNLRFDVWQDYEGAEKALACAVALAPNDVTASIDLGCAQLALGKYSQADSNIERVRTVAHQELSRVEIVRLEGALLRARLWGKNKISEAPAEFITIIGRLDGETDLVRAELTYQLGLTLRGLCRQAKMNGSGNLSLSQAYKLISPWLAQLPTGKKPEKYFPDLVVALVKRENELEFAEAAVKFLKTDLKLKETSGAIVALRDLIKRSKKETRVEAPKPTVTLVEADRANDEIALARITELLGQAWEGRYLYSKHLKLDEQTAAKLAVRMNEEVGELGGIYRAVGAPARAQLRYRVMQELPGLVRAGVIEFATLLAYELSSADADFRAEVREQFGQLLSEKPVRDMIFGLLNKTWGFLERTTTAVAAGKYKGTRLSAQKIPSPDTINFFSMPEIFDFYFETLRGVKGIDVLFRSVIFSPYGEPSSWRSCWYWLLAKTVKDKQLLFSLQRKALDADPGNIGAKLDLSRAYRLLDQPDRSDQLINEVLELDHFIPAKIRAYARRMANLALRSYQLAASIREPARRAEECRVFAEQAERDLVELADLLAADPELAKHSQVRSDWEVTVMNVGNLWYTALDPQLALQFYEKARVLDPLDKDNLEKTGKLYLLLGNSGEAVKLFSLAIVRANESRKDTGDLLCWAAESQILSLNFGDAAEAAELALKVVPDHPEALFVAAKTYALMGKETAAREALAKLAVKVNSINDPEQKRELEAKMLLAEALVQRKWGKPTVALALFNKALEKQVQLGDLMYEEADCRRYLVESYLAWMMGAARKRNSAEPEERETLKQQVSKWAELAIREAETLNRKFPFSVFGHRLAISPLMLIDRYPEALANIKWLWNNNNGFTTEIMANLIIIANLEGTSCQEQAQELLVEVDQRIRAVNPAGAQAFIDQAKALVEGQVHSGNRLEIK